MNWEAIGAVGELVGATAVVFSLLYLARQLRESATQSKIANAFSLNSAGRQLVQGIAAEAELAGIYHRGAKDGLNALDGTVRFRFVLLAHQLMRTFEEAHLNRLQGHIPEWQVTAIDPHMRDLMAMPGYQDYWRLRSHLFAPEFRALVEDLDLLQARPMYGPEYGSAPDAPSPTDGLVE